MVIPPRNFFSTDSLNTCAVTPMKVSLGIPVYALRSLPPTTAVAIPRRFSSSSLPPSFASGRFAVLCFSSRRRPGRAATRRG
jgi:hypothetical protein